MSSSDLVVVTEGLTKRFGDSRPSTVSTSRFPRDPWSRCSDPTAPAKPRLYACWPHSSSRRSGTATVCGYDVVKDSDAVRSVLSLTGQFAALEDNLTAQENLMLMARLRGYSRKSAAGRHREPHRTIRHWRVPRQARQVGLRGSTPARRLSREPGGPAAGLILDEPTTGLDPRSRQVVWSTIRELVATGVTLFLTTQYLEEADALADYIVLIDHGRATASGTANDLKARIGDQRVDVIAADTAGLERW